MKIYNVVWTDSAPLNELQPVVKSCISRAHAERVLLEYAKEIGENYPDSFRLLTRSKLEIHMPNTMGLQLMETVNIIESEL